MAKPINLGRVKELAAVLNGLDPEARTRLIADVARRDPTLAMALERELFTFDELALLQSADLQLVLKEVDRSTLALAMRKTTAEVKAAVLKSMPARAARDLEAEIAASPPRPMSEVDRAQQKVLGIAKQLESDGKITRNSK